MSDRRHHDVSSYLAWMGNYLSDYDDEEQTPKADSDDDGFDNFTEYVFSLNPRAFSNVSDFQASGLVPNPSNANRPHFTCAFTLPRLMFCEKLRAFSTNCHARQYIRLKSPAVVSYQVLVSDDLTFWDSSGAQLETVGAPIPQADGVSEQVTLRLRQPASLAVKKYLKFKASLP